MDKKFSLFISKLCHCQIPVAVFFLLQANTRQGTYLDNKKKNKEFVSILVFMRFSLSSD